MLDSSNIPLNADALPRSHGRACVALTPDGRVARLSQSGSAKAILPYGRAADIVFLNTSGGLTAGDKLGFSLDIPAGCQATATTQTAERAYRAAGGIAKMSVRADIGAGGRLDWLPQETIIYDGAALHRDTGLHLRGNAACLTAETIILGRTAMGETVSRLNLIDRRQITRNGRPVAQEALRLTDAVLARRDNPALLGGARAISTLIFVASGAEDAVTPIRALLDQDGVRAAASGFDGRLIIRMAADDGWPLRQLLMRLMAQLRGGTVPRLWRM